MWGGWYPSLNGEDASVLTVLWTVNQDTIIWDVPAMLILPDLCHMFDAQWLVGSVAFTHCGALNEAELL